MIPVTKPLFIVIAIWIALEICPASAAEPTIVEHVTKRIKEPGVGLATKLYEPSKGELPFFKMLAPAEVKTGGLAGPYDITKKSGKFVGWFGIVREVEEDATGKQTVLTVEHKYFDGFTDALIMALSFNGSGDFHAVLNGPAHEIPLLALVKVYGTVAPAAEGKLPRVNAQFIRVWHWQTFAFLHAQGEQRGSEQWRRLNEVDLENICQSYPGRMYYQDRLGTPRISKPVRRHLLRIAGPMKPDLEARVNKMIDSIYGGFNGGFNGGFPSPHSPMHDVRGEEAAIAVLAECLQDPDESIRMVASVWLGAVGPKAIPWLISALQSKDAGVRSRAAFALSDHQSAAKDAVPTLTALLADADPRVRSMSALALGRIELAARSAEPQLRKLLDDGNHDVRMKAAFALWYVTVKPQPSVEVLARLLAHEDQNVRWEAADKLGEIGPAAKDAVTALVAALSDKDDYVRSEAAENLGDIGPNAKAAVPALAAALSDKRDSVRRSAAVALGRIRADANVAVPGLIAATSDPEYFVRRQVVDALAEFGPAASAAVPVLVEILKDDADETVRGAAARALAKIEVTGKVVVPVLIESLLHDPGADVRRDAALALTDLGPKAADTVEALTKALKDPDLTARLCAAEALWKIDRQGDVAVPVFIEALRGDDWLAHRWAAWKLPGSEPEATRAIPTLIENLTRIRYVTDDPVDYDAVEALGRIGPRATAAVEPLTKLLHKKNGETRIQVADALCRIRDDDKFLQILIDALDSSEPFAPHSAAASLGNLGPKAEAAIPALTEMLEHPEMLLRQTAAEALKKIKPAADGE